MRQTTTRTRANRRAGSDQHTHARTPRAPRGTLDQDAQHQQPTATQQSARPADTRTRDERRIDRIVGPAARFAGEQSARPADVTIVYRCHHCGNAWTTRRPLDATSHQNDTRPCPACTSGAFPVIRIVGGSRQELAELDRQLRTWALGAQL